MIVSPYHALVVLILIQPSVVSAIVIKQTSHAYIYDVHTAAYCSSRSGVVRSMMNLNISLFLNRYITHKCKVIYRSKYHLNPLTAKKITFGLSSAIASTDFTLPSHNLSK